MTNNFTHLIEKEINILTIDENVVNRLHHHSEKKIKFIIPKLIYQQKLTVLNGYSQSYYKNILDVMKELGIPISKQIYDHYKN